MPEEKKNLSHLRNLGIIAHIDGGKTTTTERFLYHTGKKRKIGDVDEGNTTTDSMDQEKERGITIQSACITIYWKSFQINLIDTPGHVDFTAEVERSLRVLDGAIVILDGKKGVEAQTETVWRQANKYQIPRLVFINKMDSVDGIEKFTECLKSIKDKFNVNPFPLQFPIGAGKELKGVIDIVEQKAHYFQFGEKDENYQTQEIPDDLLSQAHQYYQELLEKIIEYDENLALKYLEGQKLTVAEIKKLIRQATLTGKFFPVFCGSAHKNIGVKLLLDAVVDYLPSPLDKEGLPYFSPKDKSKQGLVNCNTPLFLALAFKIIISYNNKLTFFRVYGGTLKANSYIYNVNSGKEERGRLVRINADDKEDISEVGPGDIAGIMGLEYTITGDTFGEKNNPFLLETIDFAEPVITQAIEPKTNQDKDRLKEALEKLRVQDPSFKYWIDRETGQMIIAGMGELHLEISIERLRREHKLDILTKQQKVSYRENIKETTETWAEYKKQSGGHGHFARILVRFEPNPERGFEFVNAIRGDSVPKKFAQAVKDGIEEVMSAGLLLGYRLTDIKATLLDGKTHPVDSAEEDFKEAGVLALRESKEKLGLVLLEPIMKVEITIPIFSGNEKQYGEVLSNLTSHRGIIEESEENQQFKTRTLQAKVPLSQMFGYSTTLRSITQGRGNYSMEFSHYQQVPTVVLNEILKEEKLT